MPAWASRCLLRPKAFSSRILFRLTLSHCHKITFLLILSSGIPSTCTILCKDNVSILHRKKEIFSCSRIPKAFTPFFCTLSVLSLSPLFQIQRHVLSATFCKLWISDLLHGDAVQSKRTVASIVAWTMTALVLLLKLVFQNLFLFLFQAAWLLLILAAISCFSQSLTPAFASCVLILYKKQ